MKRLIILIVFLFLISSVNAQTGGGGGSSFIQTFACEDIYKDAINETVENYNTAIEELEAQRERTKEIGKQLGKRANILEIIILFLILYLIIISGMNLQQIKDKGFRKWWRKE